MDIKLSLLIFATEVLSIFLVIKIWRGYDYRLFKCLRTALSLVPIIGPFFYLFTDKMPPIQPRDQIDKPSSINHLDLGGIPNFDRQWQSRKLELEQEIKVLKEQLDEK